MYLELFSYLLIRKQPLGTWLLLINVFIVELGPGYQLIYLLIRRKRPFLGTWIPTCL